MQGARNDEVRKKITVIPAQAGIQTNCRPELVSGPMMKKMLKQVQHDRTGFQPSLE
jgi:hypothetical protein